MKTDPRPPRKPRIHGLVVKGDLDGLVRELERGTDPNRLWVGGLTPLHLAADEANFEAARILLEAGADPGASCDPGQENALHIAARRGATEIVRLLLDQGLDPKHADDRGWTPLHNAADGGEGTLTAVLCLLDRQAPIDALTADGETPLLLAAQASNLAVAFALISRGASLSPVAEYGWDALTAASKALEAAKQNPGEVHQIRVDTDLVRILTPP